MWPGLGPGTPLRFRLPEAGGAIAPLASSGVALVSEAGVCSEILGGDDSWTAVGSFDTADGERCSVMIKLGFPALGVAFAFGVVDIFWETRGPEQDVQEAGSGWDWRRWRWDDEAARRTDGGQRLSWLS